MKNSSVSCFTQSRTEFGSQDVSEGHVFGSLIGGITEHVTLVTSTDFLLFLVNVHSLGNIWGLLLNSNEHIAGLVVEPL